MIIDKQLRQQMVKTLDEVENLMIRTGKKDTSIKKNTWLKCYPVWKYLTYVLKKTTVQD